MQEKCNHVELFYLDNFIGIWDNVLSEDFCKWIKDYFDKSSFVHDRNLIYVQDKQMLLNAFLPDDAKYIHDGVNLCLTQYIQKYPYLTNFTYCSSNVLIQKTDPTCGYHNFHAEDSTFQGSSRTLTWTVYLNNLEDSGETEFLYQQIKIKPKTGRVAICPGSFTHLHRGNPPSKSKYIATGWYLSNIGMHEFNPNLSR